MEIKKNKSGFTLIELATVLAIIGVLIAVGLPVYRRVSPNIDLSGASRDIASDLRYAQQLTVSEQIIYAVRFNVVQKKYSVIKLSDGAIIKTKTLSDSVSIQSISPGLTDQTVTFNVTGGVATSGDIFLVNTNNRTVKIEVKPSGYVKINQ